MRFGTPTPVAGPIYEDKDSLVKMRTWGIGPELNRNAWRTTVEAIRRCAKSFIGKPGIRYEKCEIGGCELDHVSSSPDLPCMRILELQEPYRVSTIVDVEVTSEGTAYFVHEVHDGGLRRALRVPEQMFVSPSVCPSPGSVERKGVDTWGRPVDVLHDWVGLHTALVSSPAYGPKATVVSSCEGAACDPKLGDTAPEFTSIRVKDGLRGPGETRPGETSILNNPDATDVTASDNGDLSRLRGMLNSRA